MHSTACGRISVESASMGSVPVDQPLHDNGSRVEAWLSGVNRNPTPCTVLTPIIWLPRSIRPTHRIWAMARYFAHLLAEMLKAGLVIMRIIYTRPKGIEPKLVWFHTPLKTDRRRAMLADSITLTAGTITVRAEDGRMLVHTLDTPLAEGIEDSSFQQRLERMEAAQWNK